jgi:hypothetical protein
VQVCLESGVFDTCDCDSTGPATGSGGGSTTSATGTGGAAVTSSSGSGGSGGMMCPAGEALCGDNCVNLQTDDAHCGKCDSACPTGISCSMGVCSCPSGETFCGGNCIPVLADDKNCGGCDHDCLGATCAAGVCESETLLTLQTEPYAIAIDATDIYVVSAGSNNHIARAPLTGGSLDILASGQAFPRDLALVPDGVVWTNKGVGQDDGEIVHLQVQQQILFGLQGNLTTGVWAIATSGDYAYWANQATGKISRSDISNNPMLEVLATVPGGTPWDIAVDGSHVYWTNYDSSDVRRVPVAGGTQQQIATGLSHPTGIAIDASYVYWAEETSGRIARVKLAGGQVEEIATGQSTPAHVAVDASHIYWTNYSVNGDVMRASLAGGDLVKLATKQDKPYAIAVDGSHAYWSNFSGGQVMRVAK